MSRTRHVARSQAPSPPREASLTQLIAEINSQSNAVRSFTATVDLEPTTGSAYSGVIKQYHDVRGFILVERPEWIRMVGQAPVVRTDIFDMVSDGRHFSLYIPSRNKFYVGPTSVTTSSRNSLESLRPQHVLDALLLQPLDVTRASYFVEDAAQGLEQDYVITETSGCGPGPMNLKRKIWFDRSTLEISRAQLYGAGGSYLEDVRYSDYRDFGSVHYPARIEIRRPVEDYSLTIRILEAHFNESLPLSKFTLKKPASAQQINLGSPGEAEVPSDR